MREVVVDQSASGEPGVPALEMRGISKTFPGVKALDRVELKAWGGEVLALMGENGAGKSTLMKILSGAYRADAGGEILIDGKPVQITDPISAKGHGIAIIYQELALAPNLSVAENIYLGTELAKSGGRIDRKTMYESCRPVLERLGAPFAPKTPVGDAVDRQPATGGNRPGAARQIAHPGAGRADHGAVVARDRAAVRAGAPASQRGDRADLHQPPHGRDLRTRRPRLGAARRHLCRHAASTTRSAPRRWCKMMVGRDLSTFYKKDHDPHGGRGPVVLEVKGLTDGRRLHPCSFALHRGEVLGIAGLVGSGRTELARLIYGADREAIGRSAAGGQAGFDRCARGSAGRRHRLSHRGPQAARPVPRHVLWREHQHRRDRASMPGAAAS